MIAVQWLGTVEYLQALERQHILAAERAEDRNLTDVLLLLEHPPTYTMGKRGKMEHLLLRQDVLARMGFAFHTVDRGGDITYHGPGQLVGYPILNLKQRYCPGTGRGIDLHRYVHDVEEMLILTLTDSGIRGQRCQGYPGVWVESDSGLAKIAAIGIRVNRRGISSHGFALNVDPDLSHFQHIIPCGISSHGVTSIAALSGHSVDVQDILPRLCRAFSQTFQAELVLQNF